MMTGHEWEQFFALLSAITDAPGTWQQKKAELVQRAISLDAIGELVELVVWFGGEIID